LIFLVFAALMMIRGISLSTKIAGIFFAFEMVILVLVSIIALIKFHSHLTLMPFEPKHITNGIKGLAVSFPLAVYLFIGWENSAALAEETTNPRKAVPKAVFASIGIMIVSYVLFDYATVVGFSNNVGKLSSSPIPFLNVAHGAILGFVFFAYLAGLTSTLGALIAGTNSQARLVFNAGREGLVPKFIGKVDEKRRTPINALLFFLTIATSIILIWGLLHIIGGHSASGSGQMSAINMFFESSTFGTILVLVVYALCHLALPVYYRRHHPDLFHWFRHGVLPIVGALTILVPLYYLAKPGQGQPYNWYPWAALGFIVVAFAYSMVLVRRDPSIGDRIGSIVADE
jgi:amino acid transporter